MSPPTPLIDFLYADHERVASFLAQITGEGSPTQTSESATHQKKNSRGGGIRLGVVEGTLGSDREWSKEIRLTYDPLWINSRRLIDHCSASGLNETPIKVGQLRSVTGTLIAYDFSSLTGMLNADSMVDFIAGGITSDTQGSSKQVQTKTKQTRRNEAEVTREFLKSLPLSIAFVLVSDVGHFWLRVKQEYLSLNELDIPLKFPIHVSGTWRALGIVDALANDHATGIQPIIDRQIDGLFPAMLLQMMPLIGATAGMFGRPLAAHGLSPLVVYREVDI